ncbi:MAG: DNA-binding protein [Acidobacteria bacterium]|nr:DNA-binding protein [Acidobacteriota bacterium]
MKTLEVQLDEQEASRLEAIASRLGVTSEELAKRSILQTLARVDDDFASAAEYVLSKNRELYRRLS